MGIAEFSCKTITSLPSYVAGERSLPIGGVPGETPVVRWAGSKRRLLSLLSVARPVNYHRYIEPFAGSATYFLSLAPARAIISDVNSELIHLYEMVRANPRSVWREVSKMPASENFYYELRDLNPEELSQVGRAARFWYLNRYCFNGVYRTNLEGRFNVSRGQGNLGIPDYDLLKAFSDRLASADLFCADFEKIFEYAGEDDFIYLDPPYIEKGKRDRGEYGAGTFNSGDLHRLLGCMETANARGVKVLLSYLADENVLSRLGNWNIRRVSVLRSVSSKAHDRVRAEEVIISNYQQ